MNRYKRICSPLHKPFCQPANFELPSTHSVPLYIQFFLFSSREIFRFFAHNFIFFEFIKKIKLLPFSTNILIRKKIFLPPPNKKGAHYRTPFPFSFFRSPAASLCLAKSSDTASFIIFLRTQTSSSCSITYNSKARQKYLLIHI